MTVIRMLTLGELWESLERRERDKEIVKIHLKGKEGDYANSYYVGFGCNDFFGGDQTPTISLAQLTTAFFIDSTKRNLDGCPVIIWVHEKELFLWNKEKPEYYYKVLEITTPKKGNSILKLEDLCNKGRVFHLRIPKNWDIVNNRLGLVRDG